MAPRSGPSRLARWAPTNPSRTEHTVCDTGVTYAPLTQHACYLVITPNQVDYFIHGIGTGGCVAGVGKFLKEKNPACKARHLVITP